MSSSAFHARLNKQIQEIEEEARLLSEAFLSESKSLQSGKYAQLIAAAGFSNSPRGVLVSTEPI